MKNRSIPTYPMFMFVGVLIVVLSLCPVGSAAETYSFNVIQPYNNLADAMTGEAYLSVEVAAYSASEVRFRFMNDDPAGSSIFSIYFDDNVLKTGTDVLSNYRLGDATSGVVFEEDKGAPPGGNNLTPSWKKKDSIFVADKAGAAANGINAAGEYQDVLADGLYTDVLAALDSGSLRLALHVGAFPCDGSESFFNGRSERTPVVPLPSALLSGFVGLGVVVSRLRRRS